MMVVVATLYTKWTCQKTESVKNGVSLSFVQTKTPCSTPWDHSWVSADVRNREYIVYLSAKEHAALLLAEPNTVVPSGFGLIVYRQT
jgi:hypothetical protein